VDTGSEFCRQFNAAGYNFKQISYKDGDDEARKAIIDDFARPESDITGLISCEIFTKGFDNPGILCGISARPYRKSLSSHIQQLGRVQRPYPEKEYGLWICNSGNYLRFQQETDKIFEEGIHELDNGAIEEACAKKNTDDIEKKSSKCRHCGFVMPPGAQRCPACGKERVRSADVEMVAGDLVEVGANKKEDVTKLSAHDLFDQLSYWALEKSKGDVERANRMAVAKYKTWTGRFPKGHFGDRPPMVPSKVVIGRIQHDNIAYAKGKGKK
jgi:superfamily II DNA or RNA helicase